MLEYVGKRIREAREAAGYSQKTLGLALGLSDKAISAYESGRTLPPLDTIYKIAKELKVKIEIFLSEEETKVTVAQRLENIEQALKDCSATLENIKAQVMQVKNENPLTPPNQPL